MKIIELTQGKQVTVDSTDFEWLNQWKWTFDGRYAHRKLWPSRKKVYMHRLIMNNPGCDVDHKDTNKLNCQRSNLRLSDRSRNLANNPILKNNTSGFRGVVKRKQKVGVKWVAQIQHEGKHVYVGVFENILDAANAYDKKALELFGDYARLNNVSPVEAIVMRGTDR